MTVFLSQWLRAVDGMKDKASRVRGALRARFERRLGVRLLLVQVDVGRLLAGLDVGVLLEALAPEAQRQGRARLRRLHRVGDVGDLVDGLAVDRLDHVARLEPGLVGGLAGLDLADHDAALVAVVDLRTDVVVDRAEHHAEIADAGPGTRRVHGLARRLGERDRGLGHRVRRDREADALGRRGVGGRLVDADDAAVVVDQRAAGVAGVDRSRGLQETLEEPRLPAVAADRLVAVEARDDTDRDRLLQRERLADRDRPLAGLQLRAVGELDRGRQLRVVVDLHEREIRAGVGGEQPPRDAVAVREDDRDPADAARNDVGVGHDQAVARVDEARARGPFDHALALVGRGAAEHLAEGVARDELRPVDEDLEGDHGGLDPPHGVHDAILVGGAAGDRGGLNGGRRVAGAGDSREVGARVEHHREAPDDGADQPDDRRPEDAITRLHGVPNTPWTAWGRTRLPGAPAGGRGSLWFFPEF